MPPFAFFDEVHKRFDSLEVLRGLTLLIRKGEALVILGGSGTGKTVILKHIVGLLNPDEGKIFVDGRDISEYDENRFLEVRRKVGFLFQGGALFDSMTVFENVAFPLREHTQLSKEEIEGKGKEKLKLVGLEAGRPEVRGLTFGGRWGIRRRNLTLIPGPADVESGQIGDWCNGSTTDSGSVSQGSNP